MSTKRSTVADDKSQRINNEVLSSKSMRDRGGGSNRRSPVTGHSPATGGKCNAVPGLHSEVPGGQPGVGFMPSSYPSGTIPGIPPWELPFLFPQVRSALMPQVFQQQFMHHGGGSIFPPPILPPNFLPPSLSFAALYPSPGAECDGSSGAWSGHGPGSRNTSSLGSSSSEGDYGSMAAKTDGRISRPSQFSPGLLKRTSPAVARRAHTSNDSDYSTVNNDDNDVPLSLVMARRDNVSRGSSNAESVACINENINRAASVELSRTPSVDGEVALQNMHESNAVRDSSSVAAFETTAQDIDLTVSADGLQLAEELKASLADETRIAIEAAARAKIALPPRKRLTRPAEETDTNVPGPETAETANSGVANSPSSAPNFRTVWKKFAAKSTVANGPPTHRIFGSKPMYDCRTFFQKLAESKAAATSKAFITGKGKGYFHRSAGKTSPRTADNSSSPRVTRSQSKPKKSQSPKDGNDDTPPAPVRKSTRKKSANTRYEEYDSTVGKVKRVKGGSGSADNSMSAEADKDAVSLTTGDDSMFLTGSNCSSKQNIKRRKGDSLDTSATEDGQSLSICEDDTQHAVFDVSMTENSSSATCVKSVIEESEVGIVADVLSSNSVVCPLTGMQESTVGAVDNSSEVVPPLPPKFRHFKAKSSGPAAEIIPSSIKAAYDCEIMMTENQNDLANSLTQSFNSLGSHENQSMVEAASSNCYSKQNNVDISDAVQAQSRVSEDVIESVATDSMSSGASECMVDALKGRYTGRKKGLLYSQMGRSDSPDILHKVDSMSSKESQSVKSEVTFLADNKDVSLTGHDSGVGDKITLSERHSHTAPTAPYSHSVSEMLSTDRMPSKLSKDLPLEVFSEARDISSPFLSAVLGVQSLSQENETHVDAMPDLQSILSKMSSKSNSKHLPVESSIPKTAGGRSVKPKHKAIPQGDMKPESPLNLVVDQQLARDTFFKVDGECSNSITVIANAIDKVASYLPNVNNRLASDSGSVVKRISSDDNSGPKELKQKRRRKETKAPEDLIEKSEKPVVNYSEEPNSCSTTTVEPVIMRSSETHTSDKLTNNTSDQAKVSDPRLLSFRPYLDSIEPEVDLDDSRLIIDETQRSAPKLKVSTKSSRNGIKSQSSRRSRTKGGGDSSGPPLLEMSNAEVAAGNGPDVLIVLADENSTEPPLLERSSSGLELSAAILKSAVNAMLPSPHESADVIVPDRPLSRSSSRTDRSRSAERLLRKPVLPVPESADECQPQTKSGSNKRRASKTSIKLVMSKKTVLRMDCSEITDANAVQTNDILDSTVPISTSSNSVESRLCSSVPEPATATLLSRCKSVSVVLEKMQSCQSENTSQTNFKGKHDHDSERAAVPLTESVEESSLVECDHHSDTESVKTDIMDEYQFSESGVNNVLLEKSNSVTRRSKNERTETVVEPSDIVQTVHPIELNTGKRRKQKNKLTSELRTAESDGRHTPVSVILSDFDAASGAAKVNGSQSGVRLLIKLPTEQNSVKNHSRRRKRERVALAAAITDTALEDEKDRMSSPPTSPPAPVVETCVDGRRVKLKLSKCFKRSDISKASVAEASKKSEYEFSDDATSHQSAEFDCGEAAVVDSDTTPTAQSDLADRRRVVKVEGIRSRFLKLHRPTVVEPALDHVKCKLVKVGRQKWMSIAGEDGDDSSLERAPTMDDFTSSSVKLNEDETSVTANSNELIPDISARRITENQKMAVKKDRTSKPEKAKTKKKSETQKVKSATKQRKSSVIVEKQLSLPTDEQLVKPKRGRGRPPKSESKRLELSLSSDIDDVAVSARLQLSPVADLPLPEKPEHRWRQATTETIGGVPWLDGLSDNVDVRTDLFGNDSFQTLAAEIDGYRSRIEVSSCVRSSHSSGLPEPQIDFDSDSLLVVALPTQSTFFIPSELERLMDALDINGDTCRQQTAAGLSSFINEVNPEMRTVTTDAPILVDMSVAVLSDVCIDEVALDHLLCQSSTHQWTSGIRLVNDCLDYADDDCLIVTQEPSKLTSFEPFDAPVRLSDDDFSVTLAASFRDTPMTCFADLIF